MAEKIDNTISVYANSRLNLVQVGDKVTTYRKLIKGKQYSFIGSEALRKNAREIVEFRKENTPYKYHRVVLLNKRYLIYTAR